MKNSKTKFLIILAIAVTLVWGSSYLFLPGTGAQKSSDLPTASLGAYPHSTAAAKPDKVEGYQPPGYIHDAFKKGLIEKRQGGEDCTSATAIGSLPYNVTGSTVGFLDDYDEVCPYGPHTSPDVVYSYAPGADETVNIDLYGSLYDTKLFVYEDNCVPPYYACNDDYYPDYVSAIMGLDIYAGHTYYIVVDGYGGGSGQYNFLLETVAPCDVVCPPGGIAEQEPICTDDWEDTWNGGCNSAGPPYPFEDVNCGDTICGTSGTYNYYGSDYRDTDWFKVVVAGGTLSWKVVAEFPLLIFIIDAGSEDCVDYTILGSATANACDTAFLSFAVTPGVYWLWVGPSVFTGVPCGKEYVGIVECETPDLWYWKPDKPDQEFPAPSGMPDFDQNQDAWQAFCGPTAAANCLWWFNSVPTGMTPPQLIELLAGYFHTNPSWGTYVDTMQMGLDQYFEDYGFELQESTFVEPDFFEMEDSLEACQDIILLLGFWWSPDGYEWYREGGHFVTMAGVCSESLKIAISDPDYDGAVNGFPGRVRPPTHPPPGQYGPTLHNDPLYVSHDIYDCDLAPAFPSPGNPHWEINYPWPAPGKYTGMNVPDKFRDVSSPAPKNVDFYATEVEYAVMICPKPPEGPENDDCDGAIDVTPGVPVFGTNIGATIDCPGVLDWNAVWYTFELPYDCNNLFIDFCPTDGYVYTVGVVLYDECPPDCPNYILRTGYQWVTCTSGWDNPQIWWDALPAGTYWFPAYVLDPSGNPMNFGFEITVEECPAGPENDDCADAIAVGDVTDLPFTTTGATNDGDGTCMSSPNIWYCYTATCSGDATVSLCGSDYDTKLAVYDGCICDPLGTEIDCNDDFCGLQSEITFLAEEGHQYLIEVGGYSSNTGDGILNINCVGLDQGACCNDLEPYDCQVLTEAECNALPDHTFLGIGTDCDPNPCIPGNTCDLPIEVELPLDLPYMDRDQTTCGRGDNYDNTCLGYYDGGEDIIYELTVTEDVSVMITFDPKGTTWNGIALDDACPLDPSTCLYTYTQSGGSLHSFEYDLGVGTYYIMIDTWPSPDCIPDFDLTIDPLGPEIEVSPSSFEVVLNPDPPNNTADETMLISNIGYEDLLYEIAEDPEVAWLSFAPGSGTVLPNMTDPVTVSFDASGLAPAVYTTELVVTSNALTDPEVRVPVQLTVELPPDISVEPGAMEMGVIPACEMYRTIQVQNAGPGELRFELSVGETPPPLTTGKSNVPEALEALRQAGKANPTIVPKEAYKVIGAERPAVEYISTGTSEGLLLLAGKGKQADILLVDDDGGLPGGTYYDVEPIYMAALDAGGYVYDYYNVDWSDPLSDGPDLSTMQPYQAVIWFCGETWGYYGLDVLTANDEANLGSYLDGGGNLFLSAQDWLWASYPSAGSFSSGTFPYDYLHLASANQDIINDPYTCTGLPGSVAEGMSFQTLRFTDNPDVPMWTDYLTTQSSAAVDVFDAGGGVSAIQYNPAKGYKVVFTTTAFPGLVDSSPSTRAELMASIMDWFLEAACPFTVAPEMGTIPPDSFFDVVLTFDGDAFPQCEDGVPPETLTCYLEINSNDPIDPEVSVPVDMWSGRGDVMDPMCLIQLGDVVFLVNFVYRGGPAPDPLCMGDCNPPNDGMVDVEDVLYLIQYLFEGGMPPLAVPTSTPTPMERK